MPGFIPDITVNNNFAACIPGGTTPDRTAQHVSAITFYDNPPTRHLRGNPVACVSFNNDFTATHGGTKMSTDIANNGQFTARHPCTYVFDL